MTRRERIEETARLLGCTVVWHDDVNGSAVASTTRVHEVPTVTPLVGVALGVGHSERGS